MQGRDLWLGLLIFLAIVSLGHLWHGSIDAIERLQLTRSLAFAGSVQTQDCGPIKFAPLQSVVMMPAYVLGHLTGRAMGGDVARAHQVGYRFSAFFYGPVITAIIAVVFFELLLTLAFPLSVTVTSTYLLVMGTLLLPYSRIMFSETLSSLLVLVACFLIVTDQGGSRRALLGSGVLGLLSLNGAVFLPLYTVVLAAWALRRMRSRGPREATAVLAAGLGVLTGVLAIWAWYNHGRYGDVTTFGYGETGFTTPLVSGLYGLTLSIGRGIVIYSTLTTLGAAGLIVYRHRLGPAREPLLLFLCVAAAYLLLFSKWHMFEGGWTWGPRFLLTFVPTLHVGFALILRASYAWGRARQVALWATVAWALLLNAYEFLGVYQAYEGGFDPFDRAAYLRTVFSPTFASILHNWDRHAFATRFPQFVVVALALWVALRVSSCFKERPSGDRSARFNVS